MDNSNLGYPGLMKFKARLEVGLRSGLNAQLNVTLSFSRMVCVLVLKKDFVVLP